MCVKKEDGTALGFSVDSNGNCASGQPEFPPIADIHVGIVTSSLGSHGGLAADNGVCAKPLNAGDTPNDNAHLLGTVRPAASNADPTRTFDVSKTWNNSGFLAWDANQKDSPTPGTKDPATFKSSFQDMIAASGEHGCGFEASLESWYRFLVDPEPPAIVTKDEHGNTARGSSLVVNADRPAVRLHVPARHAQDVRRERHRLRLRRQTGHERWPR